MSKLQSARAISKEQRESTTCIPSFMFSIDKIVCTISSKLDTENHILTISVKAGKKQVKSLDLIFDFVNAKCTYNPIPNTVIDGDLVFKTVKNILKNDAEGVRAITDGYNPHHVVALRLVNWYAMSSEFTDADDATDGSVTSTEYYLPFDDLYSFLKKIRSHLEFWSSKRASIRYWLETLEGLDAEDAELTTVVESVTNEIAEPIVDEINVAQ